MRTAGWVITAVVAVVAGLAAAGVVLALRPLPAPSLTERLVTLAQPGASGFSWPEARQAAVTVDGLGKTWSTGGQAEVPIASVTKMMTAYIVLRDHPLRDGEEGPSIPVTAEDAQEYQTDVAQGDSVAKVAAGHPLTERQALEALMLPSADNVAMLLADWDAGDRDEFVAKMNATARSLGMNHTDYTDPSGLAASTVSTALDQLTLARKAMTVPAFAGIVARPSATIPVAGLIRNYNGQTGQNGIIGVKTGSDSAAQGCWAFAIRRSVAGAERVVYGVVLGAPAPAADLAPAAIAAGVQLADAMPGTVRKMTVLPAGTPVGSIAVPWSKTPVTVVTARALSGLAVAGSRITLSGQPRLPSASTFSAGATVGQVSATGLAGSPSTPLVTTGASGQPSLSWRLFRG